MQPRHSTAHGALIRPRAGRRPAIAPAPPHTLCELRHRAPSPAAMIFAVHTRVRADAPTQLRLLARYAHDATRSDRTITRTQLPPTAGHSGMTVGLQFRRHSPIRCCQAAHCTAGSQSASAHSGTLRAHRAQLPAAGRPALQLRRTHCANYFTVSTCRRLDGRHISATVTVITRPHRHTAPLHRDVRSGANNPSNHQE